MKLSAANSWKTEWTDLPDVFKWEVQEVKVPKGYKAAVTADASGLNYKLVNTLVYGKADVKVTKKWVLNPDEADTTVQPSTITVTLFRDGKAYDSVKLGASNKWTYTWEDLPDCFTWTVDETNVPTGFYKKVTNSGNHWTIKNVDKDVPLTGDYNDAILWTAVSGVALIGLSVVLTLLRKREDEEA